VKLAEIDASGRFTAEIVEIIPKKISPRLEFLLK
jgi:hypothetical protein